MTPAQVAHIMSLVNRYSFLREHGTSAEYDKAGSAVEAALRDAPQAEPRMTQVYRADPEATAKARFINEEESINHYMLTRTPSAPTAVEPDERAEAAGDLNQWFLSLPEGRQKALLNGDRWMLADAAFQAARALKGTK